MANIKTPQSTAGYQAGCPDYDPCPLCYGCRSYDPSYYKCIMTCSDNTRQNTCDTHKHNDRALNLMIRPQEVRL